VLIFWWQFRFFGFWHIHEYYYLEIGTTLLVSPPENDSFRKDLCFTRDVFSCNARSPRCAGRLAQNFARWSVLGAILKCRSKILGGAPQKNFRGQKHAKFGSISDDLEVRQRISSKRMKIFKIGFLLYLPRFLPR